MSITVVQARSFDREVEMDLEERDTLTALANEGRKHAIVVQRVYECCHCGEQFTCPGKDWQALAALGKHVENKHL